MRELKKLHHRHTKFMYSIAESIHQEVVAPLQITDDVFFDFLVDNEIRDVHERIAKPSKNTLLHSFIINLSNEINYYAIKKFPDLQVEYFEELISCADYPSPAWLNEDEISDHKDELSEMCCKATEVVAPTVFHLLFSDRNFLFEFQKRISEHISSMKFEDFPEILRENGVFRRLDYMPSWLQRAIFFEIRGAVSCAHAKSAVLARQIYPYILITWCRLLLEVATTPQISNLRVVGAMHQKAKK